ncbi:MAG: sugar phosphate isomerase/epimerase [Dehalococcoidales bacterium]|nr:sugar phosphate isomerase/epimerase [Dehalococcoidales bacterium]
MDKPRLSISTCFNYAVPVEEQLPLIAEAGFTHVSFGQDEKHSGILDMQKRRILKELLRKNSLEIDTIHGPQLNNPASIAKLREIISAATDLSAPVIVVHPVPFELDEADFDKILAVVLQTIEEIQPILLATGIKIAIENVMPGPATELIVRALKQADSGCFGFCYDSSHEQIDGPRPNDLLKLFKDRIIAVHLSDRIKEFADHVPPGDGFIDWPNVAALLKKSPFKGPLLFEVMVEHTSVKETQSFLRLAYERAFYVHSLIENA